MKQLPTKEKQQKSPARPVMSDGQLPVMSDVEFVKQRETMLDALAILKDAMNMYPCRMPNGKTPAPKLFTNYGVLLVPFPSGGHVIETVVMSDGKMDFKVDGISIIPVMSGEEDEKK